MPLVNSGANQVLGEFLRGWNSHNRCESRSHSQDADFGGQVNEPLRMVAWQRGLKVVSLIKLIRDETDMGLQEAKLAVEGLLAGSSQEIDIPEGGARTAFRESAERLGVKFE